MTSSYILYPYESHAKKEYEIFYSHEYDTLQLKDVHIIEKYYFVPTHLNYA